MTAFYVLTPWKDEYNDMLGNFVNRAEIAVSYPEVTCEDVTGQESIVPEPNLYMVRCSCDDDVADKIAADPKYKIVYTEGEERDPFLLEETASLTAYLRGQKVPDSVINAVIVNPTKGASADVLKLWLKERPKAVAVQMSVPQRILSVFRRK